MTSKTISSHSESRQTQAIINWLTTITVMIVIMIILGGITRLTESGLSITEWRPIGGTLPPLSMAEWQELFGKYQTIPQYRDMNSTLTLEQFKTIFWWEYLHRLWGRVMALAFFIPLIWFIWQSRKSGHRLPQRFWIYLLTLGGMGGVQGFVGWWMVKSGLTELLWVSPLRLTIHLGLAMLLLAAFIWIILELRHQLGKANHSTNGSNYRSTILASKSLKPDSTRMRIMLILAFVLLGMIFITILAGGLVAGSHAGLIYNEFPTMGGNWIPADYFSQNDAIATSDSAVIRFWKNAISNLTAIQFHHRILAEATAIMAWLFGGYCLHHFHPQKTIWHKTIRQISISLLVIVTAQIILGITTLLLQVPLVIASLHQFFAVLLFSVQLTLCHYLYADSK